MIDIDKDSYITGPDLETCIRNLNNAAFWRNNGEAVATTTFNNKVSAFPKRSTLNNEKAKAVIAQIKDALKEKKISFKTAFDSFDSNGDNMVSFSEFLTGIQKIC